MKLLTRNGTLVLPELMQPASKLKDSYMAAKDPKGCQATPHKEAHT